jgi:hypothetical protein
MPSKVPTNGLAIQIFTLLAAATFAPQSGGNVHSDNETVAKTSHLPLPGEEGASEGG